MNHCTVTVSSSDPPGVAVDGEFDCAVTAEFTAAVAAAARGSAVVVADLDRVTFLDCAGLRAIQRAQRELQDAGGTLVVRCDGSEAVRTLCRLLGVDLAAPG